MVILTVCQNNQLVEYLTLTSVNYNEITVKRELEKLSGYFVLDNESFDELYKYKLVKINFKNQEITLQLIVLLEN